MPIEARDIEAMLRTSFPNAKISVQGDDGAHFAAEVIDGAQSVVFEQARNRLHVQKAILCMLLGA